MSGEFYHIIQAFELLMLPLSRTEFFQVNITCVIVSTTRMRWAQEIISPRTCLDRRCRLCIATVTSAGQLATSNANSVMQQM